MRFETATADRITSIVLFALGAAMLAGGFTMDRLEIRQIHPASIPGLVPMILGAALMLCAVLLFGSAARGEAGEGAAERVSWTDLLVATGFSVGYALLLVGRLPFALATALYIGSFVVWFSWPSDRSRAARLKVVGGAMVFAVVAAVGISALFRFGFLVRLP